jgi:hypothetical protein
MQIKRASQLTAETSTEEEKAYIEVKISGL